MIETFILAILACCLFSLTAGPLGSLMVWRRMSHLGDTLSHASLFGVALSMSIDYPLFLGIVVVDLIIVGFLILGQHQKFEFIESKLAIFSQVSLASGLILFNFIPATANQFSQFLFGDVLALTSIDIVALAVLMAITWLFVMKNYRTWILSWISEDIAVTYGINPRLNYMIVLILLTLCISLSIKILGALLITAFMVIPAVTARLRTKTPFQMMVWSGIIGAVGSILGLMCSFYFDLPASAAITVTLFGIYLIASFKIVK